MSVATWDDPSSEHVLSNNDTTVDADSYANWRTTEAPGATITSGSGKIQWEYEIDVTGSIMLCLAGTALADTDLAYPGNSNAGASYNVSGTQTIGTWTDDMAGTFTCAVSDIVTFLYDETAGKLWIKKNGTLVQTGDPSAGTGQVISSISGDVWPAVVLNSLGTVTLVGSSLTYSETGFTDLDDIVPIPVDVDGIMPNMYGEATAYTIELDVEGIMPDMFVNGTMLNTILMDGEGVMPSMFGDASTGWVSEGIMPALYGDANVTMRKLFTVEGIMPDLYGESVVNIPLQIAVEGIMPQFYSESTLIHTIVCESEGIMPYMYGEAISSGMYLDVLGIMPDLYGDSQVNTGVVSYNYLRYSRGQNR